MKEYGEYFSGLDHSLAKCEKLRTINQFANDQIEQQYIMQFRAKLDECQKLSKRGNFKLTDLLHLPSQRVLKYHLLFNELLKQTDVDHTAKDLIKQTRESMCEVGNYLNELQLSQMNQYLCPNNIQSFLDVCKSQAYFSMNESDLFDEHMLYDLTDFASVIRTLSILSMHKLTVKKTNLPGFNAMNIMMSKSDEKSRSSNASNQIEQTTSTSINESMTQSITCQSSDNEQQEDETYQSNHHTAICF
jgi:hypothetical protein